MSTFNDQLTALTQSITNYGEAVQTKMNLRMNKSADLSDVADVPTSRTNLDVNSKEEVAAAVNSRAPAPTVSSSAPTGGNNGDIWFQV